jgi:hypothetical protein
MRNEPLILEAEVVEKTEVPRAMGIAFDHANTVKVVRMGAQSEADPDKRNAGSWASLKEFLKPTFSNLFLLGCLAGLFVLYCCSCIIHALTLPARRKSS